VSAGQIPCSWVMGWGPFWPSTRALTMSSLFHEDIECHDYRKEKLTVHRGTAYLFPSPALQKARFKLHHIANALRSPDHNHTPPSIHPSIPSRPPTSRHRNTSLFSPPSPTHPSNHPLEPATPAQISISKLCIPKPKSTIGLTLVSRTHPNPNPGPHLTHQHKRSPIPQALASPVKQVEPNLQPAASLLRRYLSSDQKKAGACHTYIHTYVPLT